MPACTRRALILRSIVVLAVLALGWDADAQSREVRTVLTVHWSSEDFPATPALDAAIKQALVSDASLPIDYFTEYLESDRFPPNEAAAALAEYIRRKYAGRRIDVVVAVSDPAAAFALQYRADLFPTAPVVASVTTTIDSKIRFEGPGATGVISGVAYDRTLAMALELQPATKRVYVIAYAPTFDLVERTRNELQSFANRVDLIYLEESSVDRLLATVKTVPADGIILFIRHSQESQGNVLFPADVARLVSEAARVPVYGISDTYIGAGVVGGVVTSRDQIGNRLGEMARRILNGVPAKDIPMEPLALMPTLDWRELTRWGIDPSRVPGGADFRFRQPTPWERYRRYIVGAIGLIALQTLLIGTLLVQRRHLQRAEAALRESEAHFRIMADTAPVMIWRSGVNKKCDFFNQPWLSFTGRTLEQELGDGWVESVHPDDRAFCIGTYTAAFEAREPFRMEYRMRRFDDEYRVVLDSGVPRWEDDGSFAGYIGSCFDISDRKQAERALAGDTCRAQSRVTPHRARGVCRLDRARGSSTAHGHHHQRANLSALARESRIPISRK